MVRRIFTALAATASLQNTLAVLPLRADSVDSNATVPAIIEVNEYPSGTLNATAWSLIYTYPLAVLANWAGSVFQHASVNEIYHQRNLASPDDPGVSEPNVDTLYSRVVLDLSSHDLVLTVPEITDGRYWNYPVYDAFGNQIANIGVVDGNKAGRYLIRRASDAYTAPGFDDTNAVHDPFFWFADSGSRRLRHYAGVVDVPGSYGTMLIRLEVRQNTTSELEVLHKYQNASSLVAVNRTSSNEATARAPSFKSLALGNGSFFGIQTPEQQLEFAARLVPYNEPVVYADRYRVASILSQAGIYNGHFHPSAEVNLTTAAEIANASITADLYDPAHTRAQGNDYYLQIPSYQGFYGMHYTAAAYIALQGYQQQTVNQTLYPGYLGVSFDQHYTLNPNGSWLFTFSGKPKVKPEGFWSLSVYGADKNLIKNPLYRFEVGDRTYNLTYPDGEHVYGPQANASRDGPFQILVQPVGTRPPANWTNNWLPAEEQFYMLLRWYVPELAMTNGSYVYPKIQNISQIVA